MCNAAAAPTQRAAFNQLNPEGHKRAERLFGELYQRNPDNPFALRDIELLRHQREIYDTLKVHCQQGGLCLVVGRPGTGKSVIKESLKQLPDKQYLVATVARTLHTYTLHQHGEDPL